MLGKAIKAKVESIKKWHEECGDSIQERAGLLFDASTFTYTGRQILATSEKITDDDRLALIEALSDMDEIGPDIVENAKDVTMEQVLSFPPHLSNLCYSLYFQIRDEEGDEWYLHVGDL